ncbi:MAG: hypothetical protein ABF241_11965 [Yoonia sp.]
MTLIGLSCSSCGKIRDALEALDFKDLAQANLSQRQKFDDMLGTIAAALPKGSTASFVGATRILIDPSLYRNWSGGRAALSDGWSGNTLFITPWLF